MGEISAQQIMRELPGPVAALSWRHLASIREPIEGAPFSESCQGVGRYRERAAVVRSIRMHHRVP